MSLWQWHLIRIWHFSAKFLFDSAHADGHYSGVYSWGGFIFLWLEFTNIGISNPNVWQLDQTTTWPSQVNQNQLVQTTTRLNNNLTKQQLDQIPTRPNFKSTKVQLDQKTNLTKFQLDQNRLRIRKILSKYNFNFFSCKMSKTVS
jgi:hypothetical protein